MTAARPDVGAGAGSPVLFRGPRGHARARARTPLLRFRGSPSERTTTRGSFDGSRPGAEFGTSQGPGPRHSRQRVGSPWPARPGSRAGLTKRRPRIASEDRGPRRRSDGGGLPIGTRLDPAGSGGLAAGRDRASLSCASGGTYCRPGSEGRRSGRGGIGTSTCSNPQPRDSTNG